MNPNCIDCKRCKRLGVGNAIIDLDRAVHTDPSELVCVDEDEDEGVRWLFADVVRADEDPDACGPEGSWFEPRIVIVQ